MLVRQQLSKATAAKSHHKDNNRVSSTTTSTTPSGPSLSNEIIQQRDLLEKQAAVDEKKKVKEQASKSKAPAKDSSKEQPSLSSDIKEQRELIENASKNSTKAKTTIKTDPQPVVATPVVSAKRMNHTEKVSHEPQKVEKKPEVKAAAKPVAKAKPEPTEKAASKPEAAKAKEATKAAPKTALSKAARVKAVPRVQDWSQFEQLNAQCKSSLVLSHCAIEKTKALETDFMLFKSKTDGRVDTLEVRVDALEKLQQERFAQGVTMAAAAAPAPLLQSTTEGSDLFSQICCNLFDNETRTVGISGLDIHQSDHGVMADAPKLPSMDDFAASIMDPKVPGAVAAVEASLPSSPSSNDAAQKLSPGIDANKLKAAADSARRLAAATAGALQAFDGSSDQSSETAPQTVSKWSNMREDVEGTMNEIIGSNAAIATPTLKGDPAAEEAYRQAERELAAAPEDMETASASAANAPPAPQPQPQYQPLGQPLTLTPDQALDDWWHPSDTRSKSPKDKEQELPVAAQPSASTAVVHAAMASNPQHESNTRNEVNEWTLDSVEAKPSTEVPVQQPENTQAAHLPAQVSTFFSPAQTSSEDLLIPASQATSTTPSAQNTFGSRADLPNTASIGEKQVDWSDILDRQGQNQLQRDVNVDLSVNDVAPPKPAKPMLRAHLPQAFSVKTMPAEEMKATPVEMPVASDVVKAIPDKISDEAASNTLVVNVDDQLEAMLSHTQSGRSSQPEEPLPMQHPSLSNPDDFTSAPGQPSEQPMPTQHPAAFNPDDFTSSATKNVVETASTTTTIVNAGVEDQPPEATEDEGYFDLGDIWKKAKDAARQLRTAAMHESTPAEAAHFPNEAVPSSAMAPFESAPAQVAPRELASPVPAMVAPSSAFATAEDAPAELAPIPVDAPPSSAIAPFENTPAQVTSTELAPGPADFVPSSAFAPVENTHAQVAPAEAATSSASAPLENTPAQASSAVPVPPASVEAVATDDNTPTAAAPQEVEEVEESIPDKVSSESELRRVSSPTRKRSQESDMQQSASASSSSGQSGESQGAPADTTNILHDELASDTESASEEEDPVQEALDEPLDNDENYGCASGSLGMPRELTQLHLQEYQEMFQAVKVRMPPGTKPGQKMAFKAFGRQHEATVDESQLASDAAEVLFTVCAKRPPLERNQHYTAVRGRLNVHCGYDRHHISEVLRQPPTVPQNFYTYVNGIVLKSQVLAERNLLYKYLMGKNMDPILPNTIEEEDVQGEDL